MRHPVSQNWIILILVPLCGLNTAAIPLERLSAEVWRESVESSCHFSQRAVMRSDTDVGEKSLESSQHYNSSSQSVWCTWGQGSVQAIPIPSHQTRLTPSLWASAHRGTVMLNSKKKLLPRNWKWTTGWNVLISCAIKAALHWKPTVKPGHHSKDIFHRCWV